MQDTARGLTGRFAVGTGEMGVGAVVAAARAAEDAGAEAVLVGEGPFDTDAFVASAAALQATTRVRIGPGIASVTDRHPVALARGAAALERLAPGRAHLGIGRGDREVVEQVLGGRWAGGLEGLEDALVIARRLLDGLPVDHRGRVWTARGPGLPPRARPQTRVPLLLAAVGERALRLAGRLADGVVLNHGAPPEYVAWAVDRVAEGEREAGRSPASVDVLGYVLVARTDGPEAAAQIERTRRTVGAVLSIPGQGAALAAPAGGVPSRLDGAALTRFAAVGDAGQVHARIATYREAGVRCVVVLASALRDLGAADGTPQDGGETAP